MKILFGIQLSSFFSRLREERQRLGLNQTEFAELAGVLKGAQVNYEAGKRAPDSTYMTAIAAAGADVLYILTGQRNVRVLSERETALLDNYQHTDAEGQRIIEGTANMAAQQKAKKA